MEEILNFMIQLGKLFTRAVENPGLGDQKAVAKTAKLFLEDKKITISQLRAVMLKKEIVSKFEDINDMLELLDYLEWQEKHSI